MKVGDFVIVANLGEMKVYKANPRDLEAEAGLKPESVKLDLENAFDYIEGHEKIKDVVTDSAGRFKGDATKGASIGQEHNLEQKLEDDVIKQLANDIAKIVEDTDAPRYFLALPESIFNRVVDELKALSAKYPKAIDRLFKVIKEDLVKKDKNSLIEIFNTKAEKFN